MRSILAPICAAALIAPWPAAADCPSVPEVAVLASAILDRRPPPPPRANLSMADALCARDRLVAVFAQPWGDQVGWKVASSGPPGAPPLSGAIFHGTLRESSGASLPARFGVVPQVAAGLLLRIRDEGVNDAGDDHVALLRHVEAVIPFLDLTDRVHPPGGAWTPALALSLNLGTRLGVLGEPVPAEASPAFALALGAVGVALSDGGREIARGSGAGPVGHPLDALAWLVRDLKEQRRRLHAGDHVAIAGLTPTVAAMPLTYTATYTGLAAQPVSVSVRLQ
jgi:2-keto-4-pentenoate hydratase